MGKRERADGFETVAVGGSPVVLRDTQGATAEGKRSEERTRRNPDRFEQEFERNFVGTGREREVLAIPTSEAAAQSQSRDCHYRSTG